jgi:hypothetical protein
MNVPLSLCTWRPSANDLGLRTDVLGHAMTVRGVLLHAWPQLLQQQKGSRSTEIARTNPRLSSSFRPTTLSRGTR